MAALMIPHVPLCPKAFSAILRASEGPLIFVNSNVYVEILLLAKSFTAFGKGALKRLGAVVQVHMGVQANPAAEALIAAVVRAGERLVAAAHRIPRL